MFPAQKKHFPLVSEAVEERTWTAGRAHRSQGTRVFLGRHIVGLPVGPRLSLCEDGDRDPSRQEADELVDRAALRARELLPNLLLEVVEVYLGREVAGALRAHQVGVLSGP